MASFKGDADWWSLFTRPRWPVLLVGILSMADASRFRRMVLVQSGSVLLDPLFFSLDINVIASVIAA